VAILWIWICIPASEDIYVVKKQLYSMHWKVKELIQEISHHFPQVSGLFGKPTIVNNIETYCNIPHILAKGPEWYVSISKSEGGGGTKLYGASGKVKRPQYGSFL
jgi:NADH:ubiquinone oxidoreductase subunit F (NADH-binding)